MLHCQKLKTSLQHSSAHRPAPQERRPPWAVGPLALSRARLAMVGGIRCSATRAVTDIFRGDLISSDFLYGRSILTTTSPTTAYGISPTTTHVPVETGSTSVISPTTHRGHEFTWGESFLSPPPTV